MKVLAVDNKGTLHKSLSEQSPDVVVLLYDWGYQVLIDKEGCLPQTMVDPIFCKLMSQVRERLNAIIRDDE